MRSAWPNAGEEQNEINPTRSAGCSFAPAPGLAVAQSGEPPASNVVIVTATRFEQPYADKPVDVSVITAQQIEQRAAGTIPELLSLEAGISVHGFFGNNAAVTSVDLRGFGVTGGQNTLILVDGRKPNAPDLSDVQWPSIPLSSIEGIELVRGSGAVQCGGGAIAGVVNIVTKNPAAPT